MSVGGRAHVAITLMTTSSVFSHNLNLFPVQIVVLPGPHIGGSGRKGGTHKQGLRWLRSLDFVAVQALQMLPLGCQFSWLECSVYTSGRGCLAIRGFGIKQSISCQIRRMDSCSFLFESSLCAPAMAGSGREQH